MGIPLGLIGCVGAGVAFAMDLRAQNNSVLDPGMSPCSINAQVEPYPTLREADVMWSKRACRTIDISQSTNRILNGQGSDGCMDLFDVIRHGLLDEGSITAYDPGSLEHDDAFTKPFSRNAIAALLKPQDPSTIPVVTRYMIKEDWIFDKQRSVMEVRIIGLAPMAEVRGDDGELRGYSILCWLYYPECRMLFSRWAAEQLPEGRSVSFEEIFAKRKFTSTVTKASNVQDRSINTYKAGLDALLEGEGVREQLDILGFDLWAY